MGIITLVSHLVARVGYEFLFSGLPAECSECRLRNACGGRLREGRIYRIVNVLGIKNVCRLNDYVVTVEVEEVPFTASIPKSKAIEGLTFRYKRVNCNNRDCRYYAACVGNGVPENSKVKVVGIKERIRCPLNHSLVLASLKIQD